MNNTKQISNAYREIGVLHNDGLDFIINNLDPTDPVVIEKIIDIHTRNFRKNKRKPSSSKIFLGFTIFHGKD